MKASGFAGSHDALNWRPRADGGAAISGPPSGNPATPESRTSSPSRYSRCFALFAFNSSPPPFAVVRRQQSGTRITRRNAKGPGVGIGRSDHDVSAVWSYARAQTVMSQSSGNPATPRSRTPSPSRYSRFFALFASSSPPPFAVVRRQQSGTQITRRNAKGPAPGIGHASHDRRTIRRNTTRARCGGDITYAAAHVSGGVIPASVDASLRPRSHSGCVA
jgi:hypothetical protein